MVRALLLGLVTTVCFAATDTGFRDLTGASSIDPTSIRGGAALCYVNTTPDCEAASNSCVLCITQPDGESCSLNGTRLYKDRNQATYMKAYLVPANGKDGSTALADVYCTKTWQCWKCATDAMTGTSYCSGAGGILTDKHSQSQNSGNACTYSSS
jgi:hypothetical protein